MASRYLRDDPQYARLVAREAAVLVPEWELQWHNVQPDPTTFSFSGADQIVRFARAHGMLVRGHALIWHEATPFWLPGVVTSENADSVMRAHIAALVARYAGQIRSWDVVNEAIRLEDGRADGLRNSLWLQLLGPGYIAAAFRTSHAADPLAELVYNETGLEYATASSARKRDAVLGLLRELTAQGVPVHALGVQGHVLADQPLADSVAMTAFLDSVRGLGLKVIVTELDVREKGLPADTVTRDSVIALLLRRFIGPVLSHPATEGVVVWGLADKYSWIEKYFPRPDGLATRPTLYDDSLRPKRARDALAQVFGRLNP